MSTGSFKVACPSCEGMVLIKSPALIGKKVECTLCKFPFKVEKPKEAPVKPAVKAKPPAAKPPAAKSPVAKKPAPKEEIEEVEDVEEIEEVGEIEEVVDEPTSKKKRIQEAIKKATKGKIPARKLLQEGDDAEEPTDEAEAKAKRKKKLILLGSLGGVVVVVLGLVTYMLFLRNPKQPPVPPPMAQRPNLPPPVLDETDPDEKPIKPTKQPYVPPVIEDKSTPENVTHLLPAESEQVLHLYAKNLFDRELFPYSVLFDQAGTFRDTDFAGKLGFTLSDLEDVLVAENFSKGPWTFTVLRFQKELDLPRLQKLYDLKAVAKNFKIEYYLARTPNPWFDLLGRMTVSVPEHLRGLTPARTEPLCFRLHDKKTLLVSPENVMQAFLAGRSKTLDAKDNYASLGLAMRSQLDQVERIDDKERLIWSTASDLAASRTASPRLPGLKLQRPKAIWDLSMLLQERSNRLVFMGTSLVQKDRYVFQLRHEFGCGQESDGKELAKDLVEQIYPFLRSMLDLYLKHDVHLSTPTALADEEKKEAPKDKSRFHVEAKEKRVEAHLDLYLNGPAVSEFNPILAAWASAARREVELGVQGKLKTDFASLVAGAMDELPPGAFPRGDPGIGLAQEPGERVSWLAGILPYLGQDAVQKQIDVNLSWRDPRNWAAGRIRIPHFVDPRYPDAAQFSIPPGAPLTFGATHFVGIAGVGYDAADLSRSDPKNVGILGYDGSASRDDVSKGSGLSNTMLFIQIPHEGAGGVSPWIAGGGATLRGVPEKNSVKPFVLGKDKSGAFITHGGKRGTFAAMADGSVRFISEKISDDVFKSLATFRGAPRQDLDAISPLFSEKK